MPLRAASLMAIIVAIVATYAVFSSNTYRSPGIRSSTFSSNETRALQQVITDNGFPCPTVTETNTVGGAIDFPIIRVTCSNSIYMVEISPSGATAVERR